MTVFLKNKEFNERNAFSHVFDGIAYLKIHNE